MWQSSLQENFYRSQYRLSKHIASISLSFTPSPTGFWDRISQYSPGSPVIQSQTYSCLCLLSLGIKAWATTVFLILHFNLILFFFSKVCVLNSDIYGICLFFIFLYCIWEPSSAKYVRKKSYSLKDSCPHHRKSRVLDMVGSWLFFTLFSVGNQLTSWYSICRWLAWLLNCWFHSLS